MGNANSIIMWTFIGVIIIAGAIYLISFILKQQNIKRIKALEEKKQTIMGTPVVLEIEKVKNMHLVGQSQNSFRAWRNRWKKISTDSFAKLESQLFEAENFNDSFKFRRAQTSIDKASAMLDQLKFEVDTIMIGLQELQETELQNSKTVQVALDTFSEISKSIKKDPAAYGSALKEIKKQVSIVEKEFNEFIALNNSGDPIEARDVLDRAEERTNQLDEIVKNVPAMYTELNTIYPDQLSELDEGYKKLAREHYNFPEDTVQEDVQEVKNKINRALIDLEKCEIGLVKNMTQLIETDIAALYEKMEIEIQAKSYVQLQRTTIHDYIHHAIQTNRNLIIDLDTISQNYVLTQNELGQARGFQSLIEDIDRKNLEAEALLNKNLAIFSDIEEFYKNTYSVLDDIEAQQAEINSGIDDIEQEEKNAIADAEEFDATLRSIKRYVEKQRLPGLPENYLEAFFATSDKIEELKDELGQGRLDMGAITHLIGVCEDSLESISRQTESLVDSAAIAEQLLQYSNRYRYTHKNVSDSIKRTLDLFNEYYDYEGARKEISRTLETIEPGSVEKVEANFNSQKKTQR